VTRIAGLDVAMEEYGRNIRERLFRHIVVVHNATVWMPELRDCGII